MDWKERFEKLLPSNYINGRAFRKAEMRKLEKIMSYPKGKLNEDERLSQKMLFQEQYKQLERSLYPNPVVRLVRNAGKLAFASLKWTYNKIKGPAPTTNKNQVRNEKTAPMSDAEIRQFLKRSMADSKTINQQGEKTTAAKPEINKKVTANKVKKSAVIVPFKAGKPVRKGL